MFDVDQDGLLVKVTDAAASLLTSFVAGIGRHKTAANAAITSPWSRGRTEGQVNRLNLIKRQMKGGAKVDLIEARLIGAV